MEKEGFCIQKSILLAAVVRTVGIPLKLGFGNVKNHFNTKRLREFMKTDLFVFHGYTELFLNGKWIKVICAFNLSLCEKFNTKPLEFNGSFNSILHPFDNQGRKHMEYIHDYGSFSDFPYEKMIEKFKEYYPSIFELLDNNKNSFNGDFEREKAIDLKK